MLLNYCRSVGWDAEAVEHILMGMPLIIDHVPLVVHKSEDMPSGHCSLYSDYGQLLERHDKSDFYRTLLMSNMLMFPALGESMMIAKASGHLLLRHDFFAQKMDAEALSGVMTEMAGKVRWWRTSHL